MKRLTKKRGKSTRLAMLRVSIHEYRYRSKRHANEYRTGYLVRMTDQLEGAARPRIERKWTQSYDEAFETAFEFCQDGLR
jgi:hypothetical protein